MSDQDTSSYWRRLLELDKPLPPRLLEQYQSWHRFLRPMFYAALGVIFRFYCPEKVLGIENLPDKPPYIIAPNHASHIDYLTVAWAMGKRREELYALATSFLYDNALIRFWMKVSANAIRIDTEEDFFSAMRKAARILRAGKAVYIHPEGLRTLNGNLLPFHPGVGVLAVESGVPLVPAYIAGTFESFPTRRIIPRPHPISVSFGKPMEMEPYAEKKKTAQAYDVYKEATEELRKRIRALSQSLC